MTPLAVDPEALSAAGSAVVAAGDGLAANLTVLTSGFAANTGQDMAGTVFGLAYQCAAESVLRAAAAAVNACRFNGAKIQLSASNYSVAEAASTLGGGGGVLTPPPDPARIAAPGPPGTLGPGEPPPALWAAVQSFVHDMWPDGDVAALHAAAGRWRGLGAMTGGLQGALDASTSVVGGQQIAEGAQISEVLSRIGEHVESIGAQCGKLAATLDDFADEVTRAQNAIRDLLHRLGSMANLAHDVVLVFEGEAFDELTKIAGDINAVLHNLGREARAFEQSMDMGMQVTDGLVVGMEKFMRGRFTCLLGQQVGNQVAAVFDMWVNTGEGIFKGAFQMAHGIEELDPRWFLIDHKGAAATWVGTTKTGLLNHILNPQEAVEADEQMFRSLLHLADWRADRPGLGLGENIFDVGTLFLPGVGEAGAGAEGAAAAARAAGEGGEAAAAAGAVGRGAEAAGEFGLTGELPKTDLPAGGRPPREPVPAAALGPHEPVPGVAGARAPSWAHIPATEHVPPTNPRPAEPAPARGPTSPGGSPAAPAARASAPGFTSPSSRPFEPPAPHGDGPQRPGDGPQRPGDAHAPGVSPRHRREPHGHGGDGNPRGPGRPGSGVSDEHGSPHPDDGGDADAAGGNGFAGPYRLPAPELVTPPADGAFFWSGRTSEGLGTGPTSTGGNGAADLFAASRDGTTLEGLLDRNRVVPPKWSFDDPAAQDWWSQVSELYATNARGEVHAVVGSNLRPGGVWNTIELPTLMDNPNVTKIVIIDPETGGETTVFQR